MQRRLQFKRRLRAEHKPNENAMGSARRSVVKKSLTGPTLLEMSSYPTCPRKAAGRFLYHRNSKCANHTVIYRTGLYKSDENHNNNSSTECR